MLSVIFFSHGLWTRTVLIYRSKLCWNGHVPKHYSSLLQIYWYLCVYVGRLVTRIRSYLKIVSITQFDHWRALSTTKCFTLYIIWSNMLIYVFKSQISILVSASKFHCVYEAISRTNILCFWLQMNLTYICCHLDCCRNQLHSILVPELSMLLFWVDFSLLCRIQMFYWSIVDGFMLI